MCIQSPRAQEWKNCQNLCTFLGQNLIPKLKAVFCLQIVRLLFHHCLLPLPMHTLLPSRHYIFYHFTTAMMDWVSVISVNCVVLYMIAVILSGLVYCVQSNTVRQYFSTNRNACRGVKTISNTIEEWFVSKVYTILDLKI